MNVVLARFSWISDCYKRHRFLVGSVICAKALKDNFKAVCNSSVGDSFWISLTLPEEWSAALKGTWGIRTYHLHGKSGDVDDAVLQ